MDRGKKKKSLTNMNMGGIWTFAFFPHEASEMENDFSAWQIYEAES